MNKPLPWFRAYTEMVDDEKLRLLAFEDRWHFVALMCCKGMGLLDAGDDLLMLRRKLAVKLGLAMRELETMADRLEEVGLIDAATFQPVAWEDRQFQSDSSTPRVKAYRERMKRSGNVSETAQDTDTDTDTETKKKQKPSAQPSASRFGDWWAVYPKKIGKKPAEQKWRSRGLDVFADALVADVLNRIANDDGWQRGYVPDPCTYLNQDRWGDDLRAAPVARAGLALAAPSKTLNGMKSLQGMKNGNGLVHERDHRRADEAHVLELGPDTCLRLGADHGGYVD